MDPAVSGGAASNGRSEAERSLTIATKLLAARDLVGSKGFAERALAADPLLDSDRPDQILAVADVLLASQLRVNNHLDWYSILQLPHPSSSSSDPNPSPTPSPDLGRHYRRLSLLLHPDRNSFPGADSAFRLVADAYAVLADPSKKSLFDAELKIAADLSSPNNNSKTPTNAPDNVTLFWTACPSCCHVHQYTRAHQNKTLRCPTCRRPFLAAETASPPPIVPGTDAYYCSWGFFPLGFPTSADWKPFVSVFPRSQPPDRMESRTDGSDRNGEFRAAPPAAAPVGRHKKKMARKSVGSGFKKRGFENLDLNPNPKEDGSDCGNREEAGRGININEEFVGGFEGVEGDVEMIIDLDATDEVLGNLQNLPFLKDEEIQFQIP